MNLADFLKYRTSCPCCHKSLKIYLHSKRTQTVKLEDNLISFMFSIGKLTDKYSFDWNNSYKVSYTINLLTNDFILDFYTPYNELLTKVDLVLLKKFHKLNNNLKFYKIYIACEKCSYNYQSNFFKMTSDMNIGDLTMKCEFLQLFKQVKDGYQVFQISNYYDLNDSFVEISKCSEIQYKNNDLYNVLDPNTKSITFNNILKYSSNEDLLDLIDKLILFV